MLRFLYKILPHSLKETIKLKYYNLKNKKYTFGLKEHIYITKIKGIFEVLTLKPLYFIVKDIDCYEKFYNIKPGDIVLDCGANEGLISIIYSQKVRQDGKVFSFEPDSKNIIEFNKNKLLNPDCNNIKIIQEGLWDKDDEVLFYESGTVASSFFYETEKSESKSVKVTSIDNFVYNEKIEKLDFIKMDIEGAEIEAVKGSMKTIREFKPNFAIASYHIINDKPTYIELEDFFKKIDYPCMTKFFDNGEIITYAGSSVSKLNV